jgi:hypothetical protein
MTAPEMVEAILEDAPDMVDAIDLELEAPLMVDANGKSSLAKQSDDSLGRDESS